MNSFIALIFFLGLLTLKCEAFKKKPEPIIFEGDIIGFTQGEIDLLKGKSRRGSAYRNAVRFENRTWPKAIIPYVVSTEGGNYNMSFLKTIQEAINEIHLKTCVR